jgi:hypothetical protein
MATKKVRTTEDILKEQARQVEAGKNSQALTRAKSNALTADATNPWIEVGNELDKFLGMPLLKFSKEGTFAISDVETLPDGTRCVAHCDAIELGWVKWSDGKPVDRKTGLVADKFIPPAKDELPDRDESTWEIQDDGSRRDPWSFQMSVPLTRLDAGGETYCFATGSKGGLRCLSALTRAYGKRVQSEKRTGLPIVELKADNYKHRQYGKIYFPVFHIVTWTDPVTGQPLTMAEDIGDSLPLFA